MADRVALPVGATWRIETPTFRKVSGVVVIRLIDQKCRIVVESFAAHPFLKEPSVDVTLQRSRLNSCRPTAVGSDSEEEELSVVFV
jgi:hypothetical protein